MRATQLLHDLSQSLWLGRDRLGLAIAPRTSASSRTPLGSPRWQRVTATDNSMLQDHVGVLAQPFAGASAGASEAQQLAYGRRYRTALAPGTTPGLRNHVLAPRPGRGVMIALSLLLKKNDPRADGQVVVP